MRTANRTGCIAACLFVLAPALARGQTAPATPGGAGAVPPAGSLVPPQPGSTFAASPSTYPNPQSSNGTIGGGNATESSSHPVTGEEEDSFDLGPHKNGGGIAHGETNGPVFVGEPTFSGGEVPEAHVVRQGDTLWAISDYYYKTPYQWPRLWSYNPEIKNPNWIYPGDEIHLRAGGAAESGTLGPAAQGPAKGTPSLIDRRRRMPGNAVFLRDQGWIRDDSDEVWGEVTGAAEDKMFLSDFDEIYLHVSAGHDVHLGQELTIFRPVHPSSAGTIVQIEGAARVDQWNSRDRVARAQVIESLNVVERGAKVGPLTRRFEIVPPLRNDGEVQAHVLASVHPNEFYGQNQVLFIDKGESSGLKPGNRLFVVRRGDPWRRSLVEASAGDRVSADDEKPMPDMERTPGSAHDDRTYPDEVVAELRVVAAKKESATCVVTQSTVEIERNDLAVARKGY